MREVVSGIYQVTLPRKGVPVNAFLVAGDLLALVDAGVPGGSRRLLSAIRETGRDPADLRFVLVTHHHVDHIGSLASVVQETGAAVLAHPKEVPIIEGKMPAPPKVGRSWGSRLRISLSERLGATEAAPVAVKYPWQDDTALVGTGLRAIHTPGHTAGHLAYIHPASGTLFVGDAAANILGRLTKPIANHDEDFEAMIASLRKMAEVEFDTACFGHGRPMVHGARRRLTELAEKLGG
jgi:glyoxylase-like metal-dependent hydrolase (beta-lactamase superfamily II)